MKPRSRFLGVLVFALAGAAAQQPSSAPLRYKLKDGTRLHFLYKHGWTCAAPQAQSSLQLLTELKIVKARGETADVTLTFVHIQAALNTPAGKEDYDSDAGQTKGDLSRTMYPGDLHELLNKPFKATLDSRGRFTKVKPPEEAKDKAVQEWLGGVSTDAFFELCLVQLPEAPVAKGAEWKSPLTLYLAQAGKQEFETTTVLASHDGKAAKLSQSLVGKAVAEGFRFQPEQSKGECELAIGGMVTARDLKLAFQGALDLGTGSHTVDMTVSVTNAAAPAPKGRPKQKGE